MLRIAGVTLFATVLVCSAAAQDLPPGLPPDILEPTPLPEPEPEPLPAPEPAPEPLPAAKPDQLKCWQLPKLGRRIKALAARENAGRSTGRERSAAVEREIRTHKQRVDERRQERREERRRRKIDRRRR